MLRYTVLGLLLLVAALVAFYLYAINTVDWSYASGPGSTCAE